MPIAPPYPYAPPGTPSDCDPDSDGGGEVKPTKVASQTPPAPAITEEQLSLMARANQLLVARTSLLAEHGILSDRHALDMQSHTLLVQERMELEISLTRQHTECVAARTLAIRDQTDVVEAHTFAVEGGRAALERTTVQLENHVAAIREAAEAAADLSKAVSEAADAFKEGLSVSVDSRLRGLATAVRAVTDALTDIRS